MNWMKLNQPKVTSKNSESVPAALKVQEIRNYICDFLCESPTDLCICSLVSPMFTSSPQHHLFHTVDLTNGWCWAACATCLCRILDHSPHLICFIHRLIINFKEDALGQLAQAHLIHVETIVLALPPKLVSCRQTRQYKLIWYLNVLKSVIKHRGLIRVRSCYIICTASSVLFDILCIQNQYSGWFFAQIHTFMTVLQMFLCAWDL
jgi:hypothetical protein